MQYISDKIPIDKIKDMLKDNIQTIKKYEKQKQAMEEKIHKNELLLHHYIISIKHCEKTISGCAMRLLREVKKNDKPI